MKLNNKKNDHRLHNNNKHDDDDGGGKMFKKKIFDLSLVQPVEFFFGFFSMSNTRTHTDRHMHRNKQAQVIDFPDQIRLWLNRSYQMHDKE